MNLTPDEREEILMDYAEMCRPEGLVPASGSEILDGIAHVHAENMADTFRTPNGRYPCCMNALFTMTCERCGRQMTLGESAKACSAVPVESRWDFRDSQNAITQDSE